MRHIRQRKMVEIIKKSELSNEEIIDLLAMFLTELEPENVSKWFHEITENRIELERRTQELLDSLKEMELQRFDPSI